MTVPMSGYKTIRVFQTVQMDRTGATKVGGFNDYQKTLHYSLGFIVYNYKIPRNPTLLIATTLGFSLRPRSEKSFLTFY